VGIFSSNSKGSWQSQTDRQIKAAKKAGPWKSQNQKTLKDAKKGGKSK
jgi:hypothetical protein